MTSPHDDNFSAAATESADDMRTDVPSNAAFSVAGTGRELFALPADAQPESSLGLRLRAERERRGWSIDEVSTRLRLPQRVVTTLESDDFARIEHDVYLRGYLASYTRLLGLPMQAVDSQVRERNATPPALVATGRISHSRYLFQRYSVPTVYVILTGLIVAPAVWLATHGGLDQNLARVSSLEQSLPLETPPAATTASTPSPEIATTVPAASTAAPAANSDTAGAPGLPLMASMVPALKHEAAPATEPVAPVPGQYEIALRLKDASWVELVAADGRRVEFGLLAAGSSKTYTLDQPVSVRLGNSANAELLVDGKPVDLTPYRRAAVAHLKLVDGKPAAASLSGSDN
ncbi:MAG TPA: helix-turn-helix domain-containing protein [Tahibacter sp.]|uniref:helix-turn-helix domain-containing protein n=1 Tax=Tahibacter sp. TaxID=2056211 RepID=UPI002B85321E|nr:helix-turn-helix domain-containing protein [Tahibacter sp.]HSX61710.1 helix-turn-helix domain-containing protein [Tahibacter sp.]